MTLDPALSEKASSILASVNPVRLRQDVVNLTGPRNRLHSPEAMAQADELLLATFRDAGWKTQQRPFNLENVTGILDYSDFKQTVYPRLSGMNITATKPGEEPNYSIVIEAHYDTVQNTPGADDNSASVAALLELARVLSPYSFKHSIILAACDMEELGLIGARQLVKELTGECRLEGAIVFETMAFTSKAPNSQSVPPGFDLLYPSQYQRMKERQWTGEGSIVIYKDFAKTLAVSFGESLAYVAGADSVMLLQDPGELLKAGGVSQHVAAMESHFYRADHVTFWEANIPAIQITDTADFRNPHYHKATDKSDTLDYEHLAAIVAATAITLLKIANPKV